MDEPAGKTTALSDLVDVRAGCLPLASLTSTTNVQLYWARRSSTTAATMNTISSLGPASQPISASRISAFCAGINGEEVVTRENLTTVSSTHQPAPVTSPSQSPLVRGRRNPAAESGTRAQRTARTVTFIGARYAEKMQVAQDH